MINQGWFVVLCMAVAFGLYVLYEVLYFIKEYYSPRKGGNIQKKRKRDINKIKITGDYGCISYPGGEKIPVSIQAFQKYMSSCNKFTYINLFTIKEFIYTERFEYIEKYEYSKMIDSQNPCDCLAGSGHEITVAGIYDIKKEFNSLYEGEYIYKKVKKIYAEFSLHSGVTHYETKVSKNGFHDEDLSATLQEKKFEIKACLVCKKCVSDEEKMHSYFEEIVSEVDAKIENKLKEAKKQSEILKICGKIA